MVDLNAHEAGNGGQSQGTPKAQGVLLYSESKAEWERLRSGEIDFAVEKLRLSACLIRSVRG